MDDFGISIAGKLLETIGSEIVKKVCDTWGYKSQLADLKETVSTIQQVLLVAEAKRELSDEEENYIEKLKNAVYDADDLFDEFLTLAELKKLRPQSKSGKLFEKVRCFFSSNNQVGRAVRMSREVKDLKKRLNDIADKRKKFEFISVNYKAIIRRREDTCSYVVANDIIGRDKDKEAIINMLLNHNNTVHEDISFLTIVGVGGLGKTALAQLVYNDKEVKKEFSGLRLWVCVSDQDGQQFNVQAILLKILELVTGDRLDDKSSMELVTYQFRQHLSGRKYLLVLDDVWNEDREQWLKLKSFLLLGQGGSKVVVTTRSEMTSTIIGDKHAYKLEGLSAENSWCLFEMLAFQGGHKEENYHEKVEIGKNIIKKCYNVPLAIRVVGTLLYSQCLSEWRSIEESGLAEMRGKDKIMSILKLSYHNLEPSLKSCFSYCAVFPKDHRIEKQMLIDLWMAHGYIRPFDGGQSIEDAAEEHFLILLRRCFFQDVEKNIIGDVNSLKIHDLMHDVAQDMGRKEFCAVTSDKEKLEDNVRHVSYDGDACPEFPLCGNKIRSYISYTHKVFPKIDHWMCLRVLTLSGGMFEELPDSIGNLMLLRYLDLTCNECLEVVCDSITKLHNLQCLILESCLRLTELPKDFSKLVKLRHLNLEGCPLTCMPSGLTKLSSLRVLPLFVVGGKSSTEEKSDDDELQALKFLTKIKGHLCINFDTNYRIAEGMNDRGGGYLKSMEHLSHVTLILPYPGSCDNTETLLQNLEPHPNLKVLRLFNYNGTTIPKWGRAVDNWATSFPRLVSIELINCKNLQQMPMLSKLPFLKELRLHNLNSIEHVEDASSDTETAELATFFPSLEVLAFTNMENCKGWWKEERSVDDDHHLERRLMFSRVRELEICDCPNLKSFPPCPRVEKLKLEGNHEELEIRLRLKGEDDDAAGNSHDAVKLWDLSIDKVSYLKSLPTRHLSDLYIKGDWKTESQSEVGKAFQSCASSLRSLPVNSLQHLARLSGGLAHFTALDSLSIFKDEGEDEDADADADDMMLRKSFPPNLRSLEFRHVYKMATLPKGMRYLTSLQSLSIICWDSLTAIPEWISCLSSLQSLKIMFCKSLRSLPEAMRNLTSLQRLDISFCHRDLIERCKANGEDHPKVQHIPNIVLDDRC